MTVEGPIFSWRALDVQDAWVAGDERAPSASSQGYEPRPGSGRPKYAEPRGAKPETLAPSSLLTSSIMSSITYSGEGGRLFFYFYS